MFFGFNGYGVCTRTRAHRGSRAPVEEREKLINERKNADTTSGVPRSGELLDLGIETVLRIREGLLIEDFGSF